MLRWSSSTSSNGVCNVTTTANVALILQNNSLHLAACLGINSFDPFDRPWLGIRGKLYVVSSFNIKAMHSLLHKFVYSFPKACKVDQEIPLIKLSRSELAVCSKRAHEREKDLLANFFYCPKISLIN